MDLDKNFKEFVELLNANSVAYLVVGGYSVAHYGFPRYTGDFDIWIDPSEENGEKMIRVLEGFGLGSMGMTINDFKYPDKIVQIGVEPLRIDIITAIDGIGSFKDAYPNRNQVVYDGLKVDFIGFQDLIKNKKASNRLQDQRDVKELEKIKGKQK